MNKKFLTIAMTLLTLSLIIAPLIGTAQACQWRRRFVCKQVSFHIPMDGFGITSLEYTKLGDKWISYASTYGFVVGDIEGSFTANARWIYYNWAGPDEDPYMETVERADGYTLHTFNVSAILGSEKTGTLKLLFLVSGSEIAGTWIIYGGTGELSGIIGRGTMAQSLADGAINFDGKIHFYQ